MKVEITNCVKVQANNKNFHSFSGPRFDQETVLMNNAHFSDKLA